MADPVPDSSDASAALPAGEGLRRQWQQPLGDVHVKLGNIVGAASLQFSFECSDQDFVLALTARWPIGVDSTNSLYETDMLKLAEALNGLARLYAIETGTTRLHVLLEARRGACKLPGWWARAPVLFATYAFDTANAQVGLFTDAADAAEDMPLLHQPHRLLVAIGPAAPEAAAVEDGVLIDADAERLSALKRWNQQLAMQINMLLADTFAGGEEEVEKVVEALGKVRTLSTRLGLHILQREQQRAARKKKPADPLTADLYEARRLQRGRRDGPVAPTLATTLDDTLGELKDALKTEPLERALAPAVRAELQKGLDALTPEPPETAAVTAPAPARKKAPTLAGPTAALIVLLALIPTAQAKSPGSFGVAPYHDTLRYYEYTPNDDASLASGGNGRVSPQATWHGAPPKPCAARLRTAAHRKFGKDARVEVKDGGAKDSERGVALIDGAGYAYRCTGTRVELWRE